MDVLDEELLDISLDDLPQLSVSVASAGISNSGGGECDSQFSFMNFEFGDGIIYSGDEYSPVAVAGDAVANGNGNGNSIEMTKVSVSGCSSNCPPAWDPKQLRMELLLNSVSAAYSSACLTRECTAMELHVISNYLSICQSLVSDLMLAVSREDEDDVYITPPK